MRINGESLRSRIRPHKALVCVWMFALVLAVLALFPPWMGVVGRFDDYPAREMSLWHAPLWQRPAPPARYWMIRIDYSRFLFESVAAESLLVALYLTWGRKP